jgi:uncharacterized protein (TIGR03435 family)
MRRRSGWIGLLLFAASWTAPYLAAQGGTADRFEVATVKRDTTSQLTQVVIQPGGRVVLSRLSLKTLVHAAYRYNWAQIENRGDAWIEQEGWTVEAKVPADSGITDLRYSVQDIEDARIRQMLQSLLVERFQLKVSRETRMGDVYQLTRTDRPLKLSVSDEKVAEGNPFRGFSSIGWAGRWVISRTTMAQLAKYASDTVHAPVADMTNLSGLYNYKQTGNEQFSTGADFAIDVANSFLRLLNEVGLELKKTRGPFEILVIESAQRPSPN